MMLLNIWDTSTSTVEPQARMGRIRGIVRHFVIGYLGTMWGRRYLVMVLANMMDRSMVRLRVLGQFGQDCSQYLLVRFKLEMSSYGQLIWVLPSVILIWF